MIDKFILSLHKICDVRMGNLWEKYEIEKVFLAIFEGSKKLTAKGNKAEICRK